MDVLGGQFGIGRALTDVKQVLNTDLKIIIHFKTLTFPHVFAVNFRLVWEWGQNPPF
jgi:hypothetical protein